MEEAIAAYEKALEVSPDHAEAHNNLGTALAARGRMDEAIAHTRTAVELNPEKASAHANLGLLLAQTGRTEEGLPHLRKAVELDPEDLDANNNLGLVLAMSAKWDEALPHLELAAKLSQGQVPLILDLLARVYAAKGRFTEAVQTARQALDVATKQGSRRLAEELKASIAFYESRL
jgi:tetratricopeptide (TPR) repeat protein